MEAYVTGKVIYDSEGETVVKCKNGKVVKVSTDDNFTPELPNLLGKEVEMECEMYFSDGEFIIYTKTVTVQRKTTHPPFCDSYTSESKTVL